MAKFVFDCNTKAVRLESAIHRTQLRTLVKVAHTTTVETNADNIPPTLTTVNRLRAYNNPTVESLHMHIAQELYDL